MNRATMILDLQYGSTGKGLIAGHLAKVLNVDVAVSAFGPNAGHTFIDDDGKFIHTMLPMGCMSPRIKYILLGPGSVLNMNALRTEIEGLLKLKTVPTFKILIHPNACIVSERHRQKESQYVHIGSTMKGTAEATIEKMHRRAGASLAENHKIIASQYCGTGLWFRESGIPVYVTTHSEYTKILCIAGSLLIEGAQGCSLSMHSQFWPYCTSRDVGYHQLMADCAIPASIRPTVIGTLRTYPIRVAHRYDDQGNKIGKSGDCYNDQEEITWEQLGVEPELTTVTKLERRVFTFSLRQLQENAQRNNVDFLFLNFCNYMRATGLRDLCRDIESHTFAKIEWMGFGPKESDIKSGFVIRDYTRGEVNG